MHHILAPPATNQRKMNNLPLGAAMNDEGTSLQRMANQRILGWSMHFAKLLQSAFCCAGIAIFASAKQAANDQHLEAVAPCEEKVLNVLLLLIAGPFPFRPQAI